MQKEVDEVVRHTRSAVVQFDWKKAVELSGQVDRMRKAIEAQAGIARLAQQVYDADDRRFRSVFARQASWDPRASHASWGTDTTARNLGVTR